MIPFHMLNKSHRIPKPFAAFWAYINCQFPDTSSVITFSMDFLNMLNKHCNGWKPCITLRAHFSSTDPTALPHLKSLVEFSTQLCHACCGCINKSGPCRGWLSRSPIGSRVFVPSSHHKVWELKPSVRFPGPRAFVIGPKPVFQTMVDVTIPTFDCVGEHKDLSATSNWAFSLLCSFLVVWWITYCVNMFLPGDVRVFLGNQANTFSAKWANDHGDTLIVAVWTSVLSIASMLKAEYLLKQ